MFHIRLNVWNKWFNYRVCIGDGFLQERHPCKGYGPVNSTVENGVQFLLGFPLIIPFEGYKNHGVCLVYISSPEGNWLREPYNTSRNCLKNILINLTWNRAEKDKTSFIWTITESCWPKDLWKRKMERFQGSSF